MIANKAANPSVFITGVSRGIGLATALLLAEKGYRVYGTTRNLATLGEIGNLPVERGLKLTYLEMDVRDDSSVQAASNQVLSEVDSIDILINNTSIGTVGASEAESFWDPGYPDPTQ